MTVFADWGGFNHNRQALRLVELLEIRYPEFTGLNLSIEVLAGQRYCADQSEGRRGLARTTEPHGHPDGCPTEPGPNLLEFQVVDAADSIAYDTHDADDALALGLLELDQLLKVPLWRDAARQVHIRYTNLDVDQLRRAIVRQLIEMLVSDLLASTQMRILDSNLDSVLQSESAEAGGSDDLVGPSGEIAEKNGPWKTSFSPTSTGIQPCLPGEKRQTPPSATCSTRSSPAPNRCRQTFSARRIVTVCHVPLATTFLHDRPIRSGGTAENVNLLWSRRVEIMPDSVPPGENSEAFPMFPFEMQPPLGLADRPRLGRMYSRQRSGGTMDI